LSKRSDFYIRRPTQGSQYSGYSTQEVEANNEGDLGTQGDSEGGLDTQFNSIGEANSEGDLSTQGGVNDIVDLQVLEYSVSPPRCESQHESSPSVQSSELDELDVYVYFLNYFFGRQD
jgi:hypothetical protein